MHCPTLSELPSPLLGKTGWPWTEESPQLPDTMAAPSTAFRRSSGQGSGQVAPWPRVSIVTPSYNQEQFIEETIRSVLLQGYPNLEYIIIDGGSTDGSVDIIRKYEKWLSYWVSEPDQGQVYALDKGWAKSSGSILAYLNSDDTYLPNAIANAAQALSLNPEVAAICGGELKIDSEGMVVSEHFVQSASLHDLLHCEFLPQPAVFLHRRAFEQAGGLDLTFQITFDFELWTRLVRCGGIVCIPEALATTRWYPGTRTLSQRPEIISELERVVQKVLASPLGEQISPKERKVIRAKLGYVATRAYLDDTSRHGWAILSNSLTAIANWPLIAPSLMRLFALKMMPQSLVLFVRKWKHRIAGKARASMEQQPRIHWSDWQPDLRGPLDEAR
jgi:glycosyltransferase involved in cell wall biosynthesis